MTAKTKTFGGGQKANISDNDLARIVEMGFSTEQASSALRQTSGNVNEAITALVSGQFYTRDRDGYGQGRSRGGGSLRGGEQRERNYREDRQEENEQNSRRGGRGGRRGGRRGRERDDEQEESASAQPRGPATLFDFLETKIPSKSEIQGTKTHRPSSSTVLAERNVANQRTGHRPHTASSESFSSKKSSVLSNDHVHYPALSRSENGNNGHSNLDSLQTSQSVQSNHHSNNNKHQTSETFNPSFGGHDIQDRSHHSDATSSSFRHREEKNIHAQQQRSDPPDHRNVGRDNRRKNPRSDTHHGQSERNFRGGNQGASNASQGFHQQSDLHRQQDDRTGRSNNHQQRSNRYNSPQYEESDNRHTNTDQAGRKPGRGQNTNRGRNSAGASYVGEESQNHSKPSHTESRNHRMQDGKEQNLHFGQERVQQERHQNYVLPQPVLQRGQTVLARYWEDNEMYHAKVEAVANNGKTAVVTFLGYGNQEEVYCSDIQLLPQRQNQNGSKPSGSQERQSKSSHRTMRNDIVSEPSGMTTSSPSQDCDDFGTGAIPKMEFRRGGSGPVHSQQEQSNRRRPTQNFYKPPRRKEIA